MAPYDLIAVLGPVGKWLPFVLIGFAFGFILESSGFGNSRKLAGQFYFTELTVLKVMFTGIIVAMVLIFSSSALGFLDYEQVWVNPTHLWPGIVGGLVMGVGFIIGGYCPGTSLVSMATLKLDGIFFVAGALVGVFLFGETVGLYWGFYNFTSDYGRMTLQGLLGVDAGIVAVAVVAMAIFMFWGGEKIRRLLHGSVEGATIARQWSYAAASLLGLSAVVALIGQPDMARKWKFMAASLQPKLDSREVYVSPEELVNVMHDDYVQLMLLDVRSESDWNKFHLRGATRLAADQIPQLQEKLAGLGGTGAIVLIDNDEKVATEAWKKLMLMGKPNAYILEGGINAWLQRYGRGLLSPGTAAPIDSLTAAWGQNCEAARPLLEGHGSAPHAYRKIKLKAKVKKSGGCG